jgi:hypothetical protein
MTRAAALLPVAVLVAEAVAQEKPSIASQAPILEAMVELESASDAKCNSTASRFEDFLFGTPLSAAARDRKIGLQKRWILDLWERASRAVGAAGRGSVATDDIAAVIDSALRVAAVADGSIRVGLADGDSVEIPETRLRQYSSIAFSLRALLAVQQDVLISGGPLLAPLESAAVDRLTAALDAHTVAALRLADEEARLLDVRELSPELLSSAWDLLAVESGDSRPIQESPAVSPSPGAARGILAELIRGKLAAYEAYNEIDNADRIKLLVRNVERF